MSNLMTLNYFEAAARWSGRGFDDLDGATRRVLARAAQFGGSWTFISIFGLFLVG